MVVAKKTAARGGRFSNYERGSVTLRCVLRGIGSALMEHALARAVEGHQSSLMTIVHRQWPGGPARPEAGRVFVESYGFELANTEVRSRVRLADVGRVRLADVGRASLAGVPEEGALAAAAEAASADFDTVWWVGQIPDELLAGSAALHGTFSTEAPMGQLQVRASTVSVEQLRQEGAAAAERGTFRCGVLATHRPSGAVVASTFIIVPRGEPADQRLTLVSPEFRGHRLSMRLKIENLRQLRQPGAHAIRTHAAAQQPGLGHPPGQRGVLAAQRGDDNQVRRHVGPCVAAR